MQQDAAGEGGMPAVEIMIATIREHYPAVQGIYLFGSYLTEDERAESDVDLALLLPPEDAVRVRTLAMSDCSLALSRALGRDVDLLNARLVSTVMRKEIVMTGRLIYCADRYAVDEFELLTISLYHKLNEERAGIIAGALADGRFHQV